jgi:hypothetical protein
LLLLLLLPAALFALPLPLLFAKGALLGVQVGDGQAKRARGRGAELLVGGACLIAPGRGGLRDDSSLREGKLPAVRPLHLPHGLRYAGVRVRVRIGDTSGGPA